MNSTDTNILEPMGNKKTIFTHVFSTTEEGKAEIFNVVQYSLMAIIPIVLLNKCIQRFIPDADGDKSSLELLVEVVLQIILMFVGIILIHRIITYLPTYSEFKYESLTLTNVILAFMVVVLSIQTKLGIKVNILSDRVMEMWNGSSEVTTKAIKKTVNKVTSSNHTSSQGDYLGTMQTDVFPPAPMSTGRADVGPDVMMRGTPNTTPLMDMGPMAANGVLGGVFGSSF